MDLSKKQIIIIVGVCLVAVITYIIVSNFVLKDKESANVDSVNQSVASNASGNAIMPSSETVSSEAVSPVATTPVPKPTEDPNTMIKPKITSMKYDKEEFNINVVNTLSITLSEETRTDIDRNYYIEVYSSRPSKDYRMVSQDVTIKKNAKSVRTNIKIKFTSSGDLYTLVKIYNRKGGEVLLSEKTSKLRTVKYILTSNRQLTGIDIASPLSEANCKALKDAGTDFVIRYYSTKNWKRITRKEALAISKAGMQLAIIYQDNNSAPEEFTYDTGYKQCQNAITYAINIGQPVTTPIYFAVHFVTDDNTIGGVLEYFKGAHAAMDAFRKKDEKGRYWEVAAYGPYHATEALLNNGLITNHWHIAAPGWSSGIHDNYNMIQAEYTVPYAGLSVDKNYSNPKRNNYIGGFYVN